LIHFCLVKLCLSSWLLNCFAVSQYLIADMNCRGPYNLSASIHESTNNCSLLLVSPFSTFSTLMNFDCFFKWRCKFYLSFRKKSIILPSPIHFVRLTPWTKFWLNLLRQTISIGPIYHLLRFLFFISLRTRGILTSKFATWLIIWCPMLEKYIMNFLWLLFMQNYISMISFVLNLPNLWNNHS